MTRAEFLKKTMMGLGVFMLPTVLRSENEPPMGETIINPHFASSGCGFGNRVAITFDDGPTPGITEIVLKELEKRNLRATFFMIGRNVATYPSLAKQVADAGHEIGNHSFTHPQLSKLSDSIVTDELKKTQEAIYNATGKTPAWFRPPYGAFNKQRQGPIAQSLGLGVVYWSVDPRDWSQPGSGTITSRVLSTTSPGSIILLHDLHRQTADAIGDILNGLQDKAYSFASMSKFIGIPYPTTSVA